MTDFKISRTTAIWLIRVCTKIVRDGMNNPRWNPISSEVSRFNQGGYLTSSGTEFSPTRQSWLNAMFSICKMLAAILAVQTEVPVLDQEEVSLDDVSSVDALSGLHGYDYFGMGHENNDKENQGM